MNARKTSRADPALSAGRCSKGLAGTVFFSALCIAVAMLSSSQHPDAVRPKRADRDRDALAGPKGWPSETNTHTQAVAVAPAMIRRVPPTRMADVDEALLAQGVGDRGSPSSPPPRKRSWKATAPPASEYCETRGHGRALLVMLGPPTSGRTLENAIRNVAAPLCAWTVLVDVVDDALKCHQHPQAQAADAETEALLERVAAEVEPKWLRESLGLKLEALGAARHLVSEDRRECGHIDNPPPPRPLRHFGWDVADGPCLEGLLPAAAPDGAVTSFRRSNASWIIHSGGPNASTMVSAWLPGLVKRVREATFGANDGHMEESTVIDVRGAADFAVVGGLTRPENEAAAKFDAAQTDVQVVAKQPYPADYNRFPTVPSVRFRSQNTVDDVGDDDPRPNPLVPDTSMNVTERPLPRLGPSNVIAPAIVLRRACPSPAQIFCKGNAMDPCTRRARWLSQLLISFDEQDSFGDRVAFSDRGPSWTPTSGDEDAQLPFPAPRPRIRPLPKAPSLPMPARCTVAPPKSAADADPRRRSLALLLTGQLRTGRTVLPASLKQLAGNDLAAFVALSVPALDPKVAEQLQFLHRSPDIPLAGMFLLNGTRAPALREDKAEYPHPHSWKTIPELSTASMVSQHYMLLAASTMIFLYEQRCHVHFDFIVRTRPDTLYRWPLPPSALPRVYPGVLVADKGWDYEHGLSDQFVFGPAWLIGNFLDVAAVYPQMLVERRLRFAHTELIHRLTMDILLFPFAKLVRTSRRMSFLVRETHLHLSAMHRQVLGRLNGTLPPPCRPKPGSKADGHAIRFIEDAPFCEFQVPPPAATSKKGKGAKTRYVRSR
jgi:hypothetical protein